jgi:predicted DNA-binding ribbon-helix-helix protein
MIRTQIQLTERQMEQLKTAAARRGISMAELIRQSIDQMVEKTGELSSRELRDRAAAAAGRFRSGRSDVSLRHDDYLTDAMKE